MNQQRIVERNGKTHEQKAADMTRPVGCLPNGCALWPRPAQARPGQAPADCWHWVALPKSSYIRPYIGQKTKNPAIFWIAGFRYCIWGG